MSTGNELETLAGLLTPYLERQKAQQFGFKHDASGTPTTTGFMHGPGGLLTFPGVDPTVFHTMYGHESLLGQLPSMPSTEMTPIFLTLTGVTDDVGDEKNNVCDVAPVGGLLGGCMLTSVFGRYERATPELEINRLGQRNNRADPLDLRLVGSPFSTNSGIFNAGNMSARAPADVLTSEISSVFWRRNISLWRLMSRQLWIGNPTNNSAGGGYKEMTGFDVLINTGHRDAETGATCRNMDSHVTSFGYKRIDDPTSDLVAHLGNVWHQLKRRAELAEAGVVRYMIAMRSNLFYELTSIWPCSYYTYRCTTAPGMDSGNVSLNMDAIGMRDMVDSMRNGKYLLFDGERVEVQLDDGIPEYSQTTNGNVTSGCFSSNIYFIPMSVGGIATTYLEYFDYGNPDIDKVLADGMVNARREGAFLTTLSQTLWCVKWQSKIEPRLIMRTPWLAAKVQNIMYCPIEHDPTSFPGDPYFTDDGITERHSGPSVGYSLWQ